MSFKENPLPTQPHKNTDGSLNWSNASDAQLKANLLVAADNEKRAHADPSVDPHVWDAMGMLCTGVVAELNKRAHAAKQPGHNLQGWLDIIAKGG